MALTSLADRWLNINVTCHPQRSIDARLERMEERHKREMKKMETRLNIERENEMAEYKQELIALRECLQKVKRMHASSSPHRTW